MEITQEYLKSILHYDPDSGVFTWLERKEGTRKKQWNAKFSGKQAGYTNDKGYIEIRISHKSRKAHRLAWFYVYGELPEDDIDHIDHIKHHNCIKNLRKSTRSENMQNQIKATKKNKTTGLLGTYLNKRDSTFRAQIRLNGKAKCLGTFKTQEEAHEAYLSAKRELHPFGTL